MNRDRAWRFYTLAFFLSNAWCSGRYFTGGANWLSLLLAGFEVDQISGVHERIPLLVTLLVRASWARLPVLTALKFASETRSSSTVVSLSSIARFSHSGLICCRSQLYGSFILQPTLPYRERELYKQLTIRRACAICLFSSRRRRVSCESLPKAKAEEED